MLSIHIYPLFGNMGWIEHYVEKCKILLKKMHHLHAKEDILPNQTIPLIL